MREIFLHSHQIGKCSQHMQPVIVFPNRDSAPCYTQILFYIEKAVLDLRTHTCLKLSIFSSGGTREAWHAYQASWRYAN